MLEVISNKKANEILNSDFDSLSGKFKKFTGNIEKSPSNLNLTECLYAKITNNVVAKEGVPKFNRSTMDGYAVIAKDTFGCSEAIPALLSCTGNILMGKAPASALRNNECMKIATGGMLPENADAVVMQEYCEEHEDGTVEVQKPVAPGENVIFKHDDVKPGDVLIDAGQILLPHHIGTLASIGIKKVDVFKHNDDEVKSENPKVAILSTGDELVEITKKPKLGEIRDVNSYVLAVCVKMFGCEPLNYGIINDEYKDLSNAVGDAIQKCDCILISGGSSVGQRDNTLKVFEEYGEVLFHGLSVKPGKPTLLAKIKNGEKQIAAFGLPGHPVASYFVFLDIVANHLCQSYTPKCTKVILDRAVSSNHGRAEYIPVKVHKSNGQNFASPIFIKSGLISLLSKSDGYIIVDKDSEGAQKNSLVDFVPWMIK